MKSFFVSLIITLACGNCFAQANSTEATMKATVFCILVNDHDEAIQFYRDKLGFVVTHDATYGQGQRWVSVATSPDAHVEFSLGLATKEDDKKIVGKQGGEYPLFVITTNDFDKKYQLLRANGVTFPGEPKDGPRGKTVVLKDLYGNTIYLMEARR